MAYLGLGVLFVLFRHLLELGFLGGDGCFYSYLAIFLRRGHLLLVIMVMVG